MIKNNGNFYNIPDTKICHEDTLYTYILRFLIGFIIGHNVSKIDL